MIDLDDAEKLANAATQPGPWVSVVQDGNATVVDAHGMWVADCGAAPDDAALIAASRRLIPTLVSEVRQLRDELQHATAEDGDWLSKASRAMCNTVLGERDALRERVRRLSDVDAMAGRLKAIVGPLWSEAECVEVAKGLVGRG